MKKMLVGITMMVILTSAVAVAAEETSSCTSGDIMIIDSGYDNCFSFSQEQILLLQKVATALNHRGLSTSIKKIYVSADVIIDVVEFDDNGKTITTEAMYQITLKSSYGTGYIAIGKGESSSSQREAFTYALVELIVGSQYE